MDSSLPSKGKESKTFSATTSRAGREVELQDKQQSQHKLPSIDSGAPRSVLTASVDEVAEEEPQDLSFSSQASQESLQVSCNV